MSRAFLLALLAALLAAPAAADPSEPAPPPGAVALLPLDAGGRLEIYGQAVATEIARALTAGGVEVVVVGASMDPPPTARLVIDGKLAMDRGGVVLSMRVRNPVAGTVLEALSASAPGLEQVDRAAAELSARVVPVVRARLAALERARDERPGGGGPVHRMPAAGAASSVPPAMQVGAPRFGVLLVGTIEGRASPGAPPLRAALADGAARWIRAAHREPRAFDGRSLEGPRALGAVAGANADRAITFEILGYFVVQDLGVPLARARVRVRISDASAALFDRVVATDTVVGERGMSEAALAARVADEVLAILRPHARRWMAPWP
jgi:hypothetical protein